MTCINTWCAILGLNQSARWSHDGRRRFNPYSSPTPRRTLSRRSSPITRPPPWPITDPNIVHATMSKLDAAGIYHDSEVEGVVADYLANKGNNALTKWVTAARDRFRDRERNAIDHCDKLALDELQLFHKDVGTFIRQYDFLSQIVNYEDHPSLEWLSIYLRHLAPVISTEPLNHEIDLSTVDFDRIRCSRSPGPAARCRRSRRPWSGPRR